MLAYLVIGKIHIMQVAPKGSALSSPSIGPVSPLGCLRGDLAGSAHRFAKEVEIPNGAVNLIVGLTTMSEFASITLREVEPSDLDTFFEHQLDPAAMRMAAFVSANPNDKVAFDAHWERILRSAEITNRTIVAEGQVAGQVIECA